MSMPLTWNDTPGESVARQSYREQAARIIRAQIISGRIEPGSLYSIGEIAEKLNVSITPVREALHDLAREGLIEMRRNRGFLVRTPSGQELDEIVQIRAMLEVSAVREITERGLVTDFAPLRRLSRRTMVFAEAGEWVGFLDTDREFHLSLLAALGNPKLLELVGSLRDQSRLFGLDKMAGSPDFVESTREHELLLDAVEEGDPERAASIMAQHLRHVRGVWAGESEPEQS